MRQQVPENERKRALLNSFECLTKKEIEWCYNELESDEWSKLHDVIRTLKKRYIFAYAILIIGSFVHPTLCALTGSVVFLISIINLLKDNSIKITIKET